MNNFKNIRELYGATQEEIATAIGVNRVTVANWENDSSKASKGNLERLSIFYGIGPEYFYEVELDEIPKQMIINTAKKAKNIEETSNGNRKKEEESNHEEAKSIPIIAMTANAFTEDVTAALAAGMNDHVAKPINYERLFESLSRFIHR